MSAEIGSVTVKIKPEVDPADLRWLVELIDERIALAEKRQNQEFIGGMGDMLAKMRGNPPAAVVPDAPVDRG